MKYDNRYWIKVGRLFEKYGFQVKYNDRYRIKVGRLFEKYRFQVKYNDRFYIDWYNNSIGFFDWIKIYSKIIRKISIQVKEDDQIEVGRLFEKYRSKWNMIV